MSHRVVWCSQQALRCAVPNGSSLQHHRQPCSLEVLAAPANLRDGTADAALTVFTGPEAALAAERRSALATDSFGHSAAAASRSGMSAATARTEDVLTAAATEGEKRRLECFKKRWIGVVSQYCRPGMTMLAIGFPSAGVNAATNRIIDGNVTGKAKYHIGNSTAPNSMVAIALSRFGSAGGGSTGRRALVSTFSGDRLHRGLSPRNQQLASRKGSAQREISGQCL